MIGYKKLNNYKWTGHYELSKRKGESISEKEEMYSCFGQTMTKARNAYLQFVREGIGLKENLSGGGLVRRAGGIQSVLRRIKEERELFDERSLGSGDFVSTVLRRIDQDEKKKENTLKSINNLDELIDKRCSFYEIDKDSLLNSRVKNVISARQLFVYFGNRYLGKSHTGCDKM